MVLDGSRRPSVALIEAIARDLQLSQAERRYFHLLVQREQLHDRGRNPQPVIDELNTLRATSLKPQVMRQHVERYVSEWYMLVIKNLVAIRGFKEDYRWIAKRLRGKISTRDARLAIDNLMTLKLLIRDPVTKELTISLNKPLYSTEDIPSESIRSHHKQMLDRAAEALVEQDTDVREFISLNIPIDRSRLPEIKTAIREFRDRFNGQFDVPTGTDIAQLNMQFFIHTKPGP